VGFLSDIGLGFLDSGSSSSSASVTSNVNLTVNGLDNMKETLTLGGGLTNSETLNLGGATTITENLNLGGATTIDENLHLTVDPLTVTEAVTLNETVDLKPVTLNENIDLKPVAIDTCQTLRLAPLPETQVCQPYHHHVGYTMFGVEFMGVTYHGESTQRIESPHRPQVVERIGYTEHQRPSRPSEISGGRGIRVRVLDPDDE